MPARTTRGRRAVAKPATSQASALARRHARMDRINTALCALLQERARLVLEIAAWKAHCGLKIADPARERAMLRQMLDTAAPGFAPAALRRILATVLHESRALAMATAKPTRAKFRHQRRQRRDTHSGDSSA